MSIDFISDNCYYFEEVYGKYQTKPNHSIMTGKKCAWCMDCGRILIFYDKKDDFKKLMNPL